MAASNKIIITASHPLELHYIKALCLHKQYRKCIQACRDLKDKPGNEDQQGPASTNLYLSFYLALSHDELARLMHDCSLAKTQAFNQAESFYREALEALPDIQQQVEANLDAQLSVPNDPFLDYSSEPSSAQTPQQTDLDMYYGIPPRSPSPPTPGDADSPPKSSLPPSATRETSSSDLSDLESHSSFDQIMTPNKALQRDISRMSLLDESPKRPIGLPRTTSSMVQGPLQPGLLRGRSTTQGLLKPIRMGSPAKSYYVPHSLPNTGNSPKRMSRLPKLATRSIQLGSLSPKPKARNPDVSTSSDLTTVSPLRPRASNMSDTSTISPISPIEDREDEISGISTAETAATLKREEAASEHIKALEVQLHNHLAMLQTEKQRAVTAQAAHQSSILAPTTSTRLAPVHANTNSAASRPGSASSNKRDSVFGAQDKALRSSRPADAKADERLKRIEAGRQRKWTRERFQPGRYRELAEKALAEL